MNRQHLGVRHQHGGVDEGPVRIHFLKLAAMPQSSSVPRSLDQNAAHCFSCGGSLSDGEAAVCAHLPADGQRAHLGRPGRVILVLGALLTAGMVSGCQSAPTARAMVPVAIEQWTGQLGGRARAEVQIARDAIEWDAMWKPMGVRPPRPLKEGSEVAVAVFVGTRPSGGFRVERVSVEPQGERMVIRYRETKPMPGRLYTQAPTRPWVIVMTAASTASAEAIDVETGTRIHAAK